MLYPRRKVLGGCILKCACREDPKSVRLWIWTHFVGNKEKGLYLIMLSSRGSVRIWICTNFVGNQEKRVASHNALITRMLKCPIMDLYIFYWKQEKRVTSYNALIEGAVYIHLETRKVLVMHLIMLSSGDA